MCMGLNGMLIVVIGIMNQCEIMIVWDCEMGQFVYNVIVWQDCCMVDFCDLLKKQGFEVKVCVKIGLLIDLYFFVMKICWIFDNVLGVCDKVCQGKFVFGIVDSWFVWNFMKYELYVIDVINVLCMMLFNIYMCEWDSELFELFDILCSMLFEVKVLLEIYGYMKIIVFVLKILFVGIVGDQYVVLFGQMCMMLGMVKNIYGIGCFLMMNIGDKLIELKNNFVMMIVWQIGDDVQYVFEGSIFIVGVVVQWLCDGVGFIKMVVEIEVFVVSVLYIDGVYFVLVFVGFGVLYWNVWVCGLVFGVMCGMSVVYLVCVVFDVIVYQLFDVLVVMEVDLGISIGELWVDGGVSVNDLLMQFQVDLFGVDVVCLQIIEMIVFGVVYFVGFVIGYWKNFDEVCDQWQFDCCFVLLMLKEQVEQCMVGWQWVVCVVKVWVDDVQ